MARNDLAEHGAKIGGQLEVAPFIELLGTKPRPFAVDLAALYRTAHYKHAVGVPVIGAAITVFVRGAAEFGHGDHDDVVHAVAHILRKSRERLPEVSQ